LDEALAKPSAKEPGAGDSALAGPRVDTEHDALAQLQALRGSIDNIDAALIHMLAERFRCTKLVGELKARSAMPAADPQREARQVARLRELAREARLDPDFAEKFLAFVIREVIRHHEAIARDSANAHDGRGG
jgi:chorismate mutase